ncbi:MAG: hypothetical protein Q7T97_10545 [Burkholderiaceae bacterium]|nr:hypothetical protein [Burkholderiaceae bacterium]
MSLNVLVTGQGASGSWVIRGEQLGKAIGATVQPQAKSARGFDAVVIVKRLHDQAILRSARWHGVPVIWDVVDAWPQGRSTGKVMTCEGAMSWLRQSLRTIRPEGVIAPTRQMEKDLQSLPGLGTKVTTLAHHAWQGKPINPIRREVRTIGYQGGEKHLGLWSAVLAEEAGKRGWQFVINPPSLADVDIAIALRRETGYAPKNWKSNVKLANAQASGTPIILTRESGYLETASGSEFWADTTEELRAGLDWFSDHAHRVEASRRMLGTEPRLEDIATDYKQWLEDVCHGPIAHGRRHASPTRRLYDLACAMVVDRFRR